MQHVEMFRLYVVPIALNTLRVSVLRVYDGTNSGSREKIGPRDIPLAYLMKVEYSERGFGTSRLERSSTVQSVDVHRPRSVPGVSEQFQHHLVRRGRDLRRHLRG